MLNLLLAAALAQAGPDSAGRPLELVAYSADSLCFRPSSGDLSLVGSCRVDYRDMSLLADTVLYHSGEDLLTASGSPELFEGGESVTGTMMYYDLTARRGLIMDARSRYGFGYYGGESITQVGRREFNIVEARFTTCDRDSADYWFRAPQMKVFPDDRVIARPVYLYVEDTPVFYFPIGVFPIRQGRQSGFILPKFGQTSRDGRYLRGAGYYFAFSDYLDLSIQGDILDRSRFAVYARERHRLRYVHEGGVSVEWRREFVQKRERWSFFGSHLHEFPDGMTARLRGEFLSDRSYLEETQQQPEDRMTGEARSWASISRNLGRASLQVTLSRTSFLKVDPDSVEDELLSTQSLPDVRLGIPSAPLFPTPSDPGARRPWHSIYWKLSAHYISMDTRREVTRTTHSGAVVRTDLSASDRLFGILAVSPGIEGTFTVYDRDRLGGRMPWWAGAGASLSLSTDLYGIFQTPVLGYTALRHTISPSAVISWSPSRYLASGPEGIHAEDPASADSLYYSFSDLSTPSSGAVLGLGLFQSLEGKSQSAAGIRRRSIAALDLTVSADLEPDSTGQRTFSDISGGLELTPLDQASFRADAAWDPYEGDLEELGFTTSMQVYGSDMTLVADSAQAGGLPWRLSLSHNYRLALGDSPELSKVRASLALDFTPSWSIDYSAYYDVLDGSFISQSYTLRRDLHCWEAVFVRHISDSDTGFYFRINIRDLPDIKIEQTVSDF